MQAPAVTRDGREIPECRDFAGIILFSVFFVFASRNWDLAGAILVQIAKKNLKNRCIFDSQSRVGSKIPEFSEEFLE